MHIQTDGPFFSSKTHTCVYYPKTLHGNLRYNLHKHIICTY